MFTARALSKPRRRMTHMTHLPPGGLGGISSFFPLSSNSPQEKDPSWHQVGRAAVWKPRSGHPGECLVKGDLRGVVTLPLPEAGSCPTRTAAHAPSTPRAPVSIHVLRNGRLAHTLSCAAPLKHSRAGPGPHGHSAPRNPTCLLAISLQFPPREKTPCHSQWFFVTYTKVGPFGGRHAC